MAAATSKGASRKAPPKKKTATKRVAKAPAKRRAKPAPPKTSKAKARPAKPGAKAPKVADRTPAPTAPQRLDKTIELLCSGMRYTQVRDQVARDFQVTTRAAEKDIQRAYEILAQEEQDERPRRKTKLRAYLWGIARKAEALCDYQATLRACHQLAKIDGLEAPTELAVSGGITLDAKVRALAPSQRAKRIAELEAKRKAGKRG